MYQVNEIGLIVRSMPYSWSAGTRTTLKGAERLAARVLAQGQAAMLRGTSQDLRDAYRVEIVKIA